jgi:deferrochelatase/peroxidase EfeB
VNSSWAGQTSPVLGAMPLTKELGRNGSYLVYRKLEQDVPAFRRFLREQASRLLGQTRLRNVERLAAKIVGRWRCGCRLRCHPRPTTKNSGESGVQQRLPLRRRPKWTVCPVGSHIAG